MFCRHCLWLLLGWSSKHQHSLGQSSCLCWQHTLCSIICRDISSPLSVVVVGLELEASVLSTVCRDVLSPVSVVVALSRHPLPPVLHHCLPPPVMASVQAAAVAVDGGGEWGSRGSEHQQVAVAAVLADTTVSRLPPSAAFTPSAVP